MKAMLQGGADAPRGAAHVGHRRQAARAGAQAVGLPARLRLHAPTPATTASATPTTPALRSARRRCARLRCSTSTVPATCRPAPRPPPPALAVPELQIAHETTRRRLRELHARQHRLGRRPVQRHGQRRGLNRRDLQADFSAEIALADQPAALVERINAKLMYGGMPAALKAEIQGAIEKIAIPVLNGTGVEPGAGRTTPSARASMPRSSWPWSRPSSRCRSEAGHHDDHHNASRRLFLRHAGAMGALLGPVAAPLALNLAALGTAVGAGRAGLQGAGVPVPVRRQRRLQHGAAHRHRLVGQLQRGAQPGAGFDRAAGAGHRGRRRRGGRLAAAPGRRAADRCRPMRRAAASRCTR